MPAEIGERSSRNALPSPARLPVNSGIQIAGIRFVANSAISDQPVAE